MILRGLLWEDSTDPLELEATLGQPDPERDPPAPGSDTAQET